jgi:hypothetical protein
VHQYLWNKKVGIGGNGDENDMCYGQFLKKKKKIIFNGIHGATSFKHIIKSVKFNIYRP